MYGDTDSIMINTNSQNYEEVLKLGNRVCEFGNVLCILRRKIWKPLLLINFVVFFTVCAVYVNNHNM